MGDKVSEWIPQVGDIIRKRPKQAFGDRLAEITEIRENGSFEYRLFGTQEFAGCQPCHVDFILRPGDRVKLLPFRLWEECYTSFGRIATVSTVKLEPLNYLDQWHIRDNPMTVIVALVRADETNAPSRWPLEAVERVSEEVKAEPLKEESSNVESQPAPVIGRRLAMDMLPAERKQYDEMVKSREAKPILNCETTADTSTRNYRIGEQIEEKRKLILQTEVEIADLKKQQK